MFIEKEKQHSNFKQKILQFCMCVFVMRLVNDRKW